MKISVLQFKSLLGEVEKNFHTAEKLIERAKNSDVLLLPELWTTGYYPEPVKNFADKNSERVKDFILSCGVEFEKTFSATNFDESQSD